MTTIVIIGAAALFAIFAGLAATVGEDSRPAVRDDVRPWI